MTDDRVDIAGRARTGDGGGSPPRMPRWVKVLGIVVGVLALLSVLRFTGVGPLHVGGGHGGGGGHMPGHHGTAPASAAPAGHAPGGGH
jgi:hypothetical protein